MRQTFWAHVTLFAAIIVIPSPARCQQEVDPNSPLAPIFEHWRRTQERVRTIRVQWSETKTVTARMLSVVSDKAAKGKPVLARPPSPPPTNDVTTKFTCEFLMDDDCLRFDLLGSDWQPESRKIEKRARTVLRCGELSLVYHDDPDDKKYGSKYNNSAFRDARSYHLLVFLMNYRPFDPELGPFSDPSAWDLRPEAGVIGGERCSILESALGDTERRAWVSNVSQLIRRFEVLFRGKPSLTVNCEYGGDSNQPTPSRWEVMVRNAVSGELTQSFVATANSSSINKPVEPAVFRFEFPAGTVVNDFGTNQQYQVLERGTSLLPEKGVGAETGSSLKRWLLWGAIAALALAVTVVCLGISRYRSRKPSS